MVEDIDINTNATISKYFWQKAMSGSIDVTSGEKDYTILFFEALPNADIMSREEVAGNEGSRAQGVKKRENLIFFLLNQFNSWKCKLTTAIMIMG